jgi:hypothetical protein
MGKLTSSEALHALSTSNHITEIMRTSNVLREHAMLLNACKATAGVFQDSTDPPLYAQKCVVAIAYAEREHAPD